MKVEYRTLFLRDLKKLKKQEVYPSIYELVFTTLPEATSVQELPNVKALVGTENRYRIRVGNYRIGFEVNEDRIELMRVLHRREFYRYFP
ncbi:type II toxin-antitoxin system RelE/ParE family toxin [Limnoraphis robusta Tam1]|uniref:type II toxin-antitoxin system RelE family toxin n=1 Tax=Limnoraphis robusta TaxID=1118279 RepID=UPI002B203D69|nr:type II toxin-antitoxin system RelE/ParE family toxin [Limnoraphis robusta]MEA5499438.1 type II toxin-antitoxin system RelE/ParE family toxin [Limnoraphis robusta BA-68 BA1]MEA5541817.1 type II toxin-antitoxin system RelE/ParE family toxin [Limnoraphis robusta Tam1]